MRRAMFFVIVMAGCGGDKENISALADWGSADSGGAYSDWDTASTPDDESAGDTDTAEPDECAGAEDTMVTLYMSADDSNSKAAPAIVRGLLEDGDTVSSSLRPFEFLNYYTFDYAPADEGTVRVVPQARISSDDPNTIELLVAVVAPAQAPEDRPAANLTFSLDVSGSMTGEGLATEKAVMRAVASSLMDGDVVSIVTWDDSNRVVLNSHAVSGPDDADLLDAIDDLSGGGSTDLSGGLRKAYELASDNFRAGRLNRVILVSDGGANTGETDEELIGGYAEDLEGEGIYMMGVGAGAASGYWDQLMDRVTDLGKGAYVYIDSAAEAERQFTGERFIENTQIAAYNVRLEMDLPAGYVVQRFSGEQISTDPEEVREQHLAPNDVMLYDIVLSDCAPESRDGSETFAFRATWSDLSEDHTEAASGTLAEMMAGENRELTKAKAVLDYVDGLQSARQAVDSTEALTAISAAESRITDANAVLGGDSELEEMLDLLDRYRHHF